MIANTPAKVPRPTIITNKIAHKIDGNVRTAARITLIGAYTHLLFKFLAANMLNGKAITTPTMVPMKAI